MIEVWKRWVTRTHSWHNIHYQDIFHFSSLCNLEITPTFQNYTSYNKYIEVVYTFDIVYEVAMRYTHWSKLFYHFSFERGYLRRWKRIIVQIVSHATVIGFTSHKIRQFMISLSEKEKVISLSTKETRILLIFVCQNIWGYIVQKNYKKLLETYSMIHIGSFYWKFCDRKIKNSIVFETKVLHYIWLWNNVIFSLPYRTRRIISTFNVSCFLAKESP